MAANVSPTEEANTDLAVPSRASDANGTTNMPRDKANSASTQENPATESSDNVRTEPPAHEEWSPLQDGKSAFPITAIYQGSEGCLAASDNQIFLFWTSIASPDGLPTVAIRLMHIVNVHRDRYHEDSQAVKVRTKRKSYTFSLRDAVSGRRYAIACVDTLRSMIAAYKARKDHAVSSDTEDEADATPMPRATSQDGPPWQMDTIITRLRLKYQYRGMQENVERLISDSSTLSWAMQMLVEDELSSIWEAAAMRKPKPRVAAVSTIKRLSWHQWMTTPRSGVHVTGEMDSRCTVIALLCEEPVAGFRRGRVESNVQNRNEDDLEKEGNTNLTVKAREPLPERIKINSIPTIQILVSLLDLARNISGGDPLILPRPYKALALNRALLHDRLSAIERILEDRSGRTHEIDEEQKPSMLDQNGYPGNMFGADADWSKLTKAELKEAVDDFRCLVRFPQ